MDDFSSGDQYRASVTPSPNQVTTVMMSHRPSSSMEKPPTNEAQPMYNRKALHADPFLPSGAFFEERYLGFPPARDDDNIVTRARTDPKIHYDDSNVLVKHKKFIKHLQQQQEAKRNDKIEQEITSERKKQVFSDTQAKIRQALMNELDMPKDKVEELMEGKTKQLDQILGEQKKKEKKKRQEKPEWAMTTDEIEKKEEKEVQDVLDFVNDLDFEEFINDFEIKEALSVIQDRVSEIKKEKEPVNNTSSLNNGQETIPKVSSNLQSVKDDDAISVVSVTSSVKSESRKKMLLESSADHDKDWNSSTKLDETNRTKTLTISGTDSEVISNMSKIHSKTSLGQVMMKVTPTYSLPIVTHSDKHQSIPTIHHVGEIVSSDDRGNTERVIVKLRKDKNNVQNLPYMYRCPSI